MGLDLPFCRLEMYSMTAFPIYNWSIHKLVVLCLDYENISSSVIFLGPCSDSVSN
jgi:hypothetical protein